MEFEHLWWHWIVLGIVLVISEIFLSSFIALWFGLGALVVGLILAVFPTMALSFAMLLWALSSGAFVLLWFKYFKPKMVDKTGAGIAREAAKGEVGQVIKAPAEGGRGVVRFSLPVLGEDEWPFICDTPVREGDKVGIKDFSGNALIVVKL